MHGSLLGSRAFWSAYQNVFAFVGTSNDLIKADFGLALSSMVSEAEHPKKAEFLEQAMSTADDLNKQAEQLYEMASVLHQITELLALSEYSVRDMYKVQRRKDVRALVRKMESYFDADDNNEGVMGNTT